MPKLHDVLPYVATQIGGVGVLEVKSVKKNVRKGHTLLLHNMRTFAGKQKPARVRE